MEDDYITTEQARKELGEEAYFAFHRWLVEKGYRNLNKTYVTKDQLREFVKETLSTFRGLDSTDALWGQTREFWKERIKK